MAIRLHESAVDSGLSVNLRGAGGRRRGQRRSKANASNRNTNMASSASRQLRSESDAVPDIWKEPEESEGCSCGIALDGRLGQAYNEEAFHYFLEIERRRTRLSNWPLFLLLIDLKTQPGMSVHIESPIAERLFGDLATCLRETDFIGWYRVERAIGAVLTQRADAEAPD